MGSLLTDYWHISKYKPYSPLYEGIKVLLQGRRPFRTVPTDVSLSQLCLSVGPSDGAVQELAHGRHRDEWGKMHKFLLPLVDFYLSDGSLNIPRLMFQLH